MSILKTLICLFCLLVCTACAAASPRDSVGIRAIGNRKFILHRIEKKETLYSIAVRYKTSVDSILPEKGKTVVMKIGAILLVPVTEAAVEALTKLDEAHANADAQKPTVIYRHKVMKGETVNRIAMLYKISSQDLVRWNNIKDNRIEIGQDLIVNSAAAISPYKAWNKPKEKDTTALVRADSTDSREVVRTGIALISEEKITLIGDHALNNVILVTNLDNNRQVIVKTTLGLEAPPAQADPEVVIILDKKTAAAIGAAGFNPSRVMIKYLTSGQ